MKASPDAYQQITKYLYDGEQVIAETDASGDVDPRFDNESSLYYYCARYYHTQLDRVRWVTKIR